MSAKSPVLVQRSLVQPANRTFSEPDRIKVRCSHGPCAPLAWVVCETLVMLQLCNFDMKSPTLNERIAVVFAFSGRLAPDALILSLRGLLDVRR